VASDVAEELTEEEALGLFELAAEVVSAHAVGFVDDDEVPLGVFELVLQELVAGELVHARDEQRVGVEDVEVDIAVDQLVSQDVEAQAELEEELVLPLVDETARGHNEAALDVVA
jgi:hypothetical protein